jgi:rfaE bifunctional protein kinase chain/domain
VPLVAVHQRESRLGGAANVAINVRALGAQPMLCSVVGTDRSGDELLAMMRELGMDTAGMVSSDSRVTTVKTRVIGNNHQLLRVDDEVLDPLGSKDREALCQRVLGLLDSARPDVVVFEDYDKGVLSEEVISRIVNACRERSIPTAVDPKKNNFSHYRNVTLFKPNLAELRAGLKVDIDRTDASAISRVTDQFRQSQGIEKLLVTLSEAGVYFADGHTAEIIPAHIRNISDVSGAGDTVISVAALCLSLGLSTRTIAALSNLAGGLVCEKVGVVPVDKNQLQEEAAALEP